MIFDEDRPRVIPADYGIGIIFTNKDGKFISVGPEDKIRRVNLSITSYIGVSPGAMHWYARLNTGSLSFECLKTDCKDGWIKVGERHNISGAFEKPDIIDDISIECERKITKKDLLHHRSNYHDGAKPGDMTGGFNTERSAYQAGIRTFKQRFSKKLGKHGEKWVLYDDHDCTKPIC